MTSSDPCPSSRPQKKANDPTRFTNRGGNLLKEEKQRSELHKSLPKVRLHAGRFLASASFERRTHVSVGSQLEKKLKAQMDAWESEQGREFLVKGEKFLVYVEEQWELHRVDKEKEKLERVSRPAARRRPRSAVERADSSLRSI